jgi:CheY-like chemotaxis protein
MIARVLVVDDQAGSDRLFSDVFGNGLTVCTSLAAGNRWDIAFVDFALAVMDRDGADMRTGLSTMRILRAERPETKLVSYTQPGESGRQLYMAAAKQWFAADATLAKSNLTIDVLVGFARALLAGSDPSDPRHLRWLRSAHLIDGLFRNAGYLDLWRAWHALNGNEKAIAKMTHRSSHQIRGFRENVIEVVRLFKAAFEGVEFGGPESGRKDYKGVLSSFVGENRLFFTAPDLADVLEARLGVCR